MVRTMVFKKSTGASASEHHQNCPEKNFNIQPKRPVIYIVQVEFEFPGDCGRGAIISPVDLGQPSNARFDVQPQKVTIDVS